MPASPPPFDDTCERVRLILRRMEEFDMTLLNPEDKELLAREAATFEVSINVTLGLAQRRMVRRRENERHLGVEDGR